MHSKCSINNRIVALFSQFSYIWSLGRYRQCEEFQIFFSMCVERELMFIQSVMHVPFYINPKPLETETSKSEKEEREIQ